MRILEQIRLTCTTGSHNKQYMIYLEEHEATNPTGQPTYVVRASYGPIGKSPKQLLKYRGPSYAVASSTYEDLAAEKRGKGYEEYRGVAAPSPTPSPTRRTPRATREPQPEETGTIDFYDDALRKINL